MRSNLVIDLLSKRTSHTLQRLIKKIFLYYVVFSISGFIVCRWSMVEYLEILPLLVIGFSQKLWLIYWIKVCFYLIISQWTIIFGLFYYPEAYSSVAVNLDWGSISWCLNCQNECVNLLWTSFCCVSRNIHTHTIDTYHPM